MHRGPQQGGSDREGQDASLVATPASKGPGVAVVILSVVLFDFAMWFIFPDGATYHRDLGSHGLEVYLSPLPLLLTGLVAGVILVILSRRRRRN